MKIPGIFLLFSLLACSGAVCAQTRDLHYFLEQSAMNPGLADLRSQIRTAKTDSLLLRAGYRPQVFAGSDLLYAPIISGYGYDPAISNGQLVSAMLNVSQDIIGPNNKRLHLDSLRLNRESLENQLKLAESNYQQTVTDQYLTAFSNQQLLLTGRKIWHLMEQEDTLLLQLTRDNMLKQTEYLSFKVSLQQQALKVKQLETMYTASLLKLNYLSGTADTLSYELSKPALAIDTPDYRYSYYETRFKIDSLQSHNAAQLILQSYQPRLKVFANAGYESSLPPMAYKNVGFSAGLNLTIPLYDGGQRKLTLTKNKLLAARFQAYHDYSRRQYQLQSMAIRQQIREYDDLLKEGAVQMHYAETLVKADALQLKTGDVKITDYVLAIKAYLELQNAQIENETARFRLINQLHYSILE